ncbi:MAG TPA: MFS transporter [Solirubrobacteraceae bacterium]
MSGTERYARVLRAPDVARLLGAAVLARMPIGIDTLAIVLFVRAETGSFARAGLVAAAFGIGSGVSSPLQGRLIDQHGHARVLLPLAALHATSLGALVVLGLAGAPIAALVGCGLVVGSSVPPVGTVVRPMLSRLLGADQDLLPTAYAVDGIAIEMVFVGGPLLTAVIVSFGSPAVALMVAGGFALAGTFVLVTAPASRAFRPSGASGERHLLGALVSPGVRTLVATIAPVGFALGATEVTMTAFAADHGSRAAAGALLAVWAAGSGVGGLAYGAREHGLAPDARWLRLAVAFPLCSMPLVVAPSIPVMAPLALIAGLCLAPFMAAANQLIGDVAPPQARTEAFAWPVTAIALGAASGSAAAGAIIEASGWRTAFVVVIGAGLLAAAVAVTRRRTLALAAAAAS